MRRRLLLSRQEDARVRKDDRLILPLAQIGPVAARIQAYRIGVEALRLKCELEGNFLGPGGGGIDLESELDQIGPAFSDNSLRSAAGKFGHVTYVSARGCPLTCSFCVVRASPIRAKSIQTVVNDIRYLVADLGYRALAIEEKSEHGEQRSARPNDSKDDPPAHRRASGSDSYTKA